MKMVRSKHPICSCCKGEVYASGASRTIGRQVMMWHPFLEGLITISPEHLRGAMTAFGFYEYASFQWACDDCLESGKAIEAEPENQQYCTDFPYLAYYDTERSCERCGSIYVFSKSEKQFWYEELKFRLESEPKHCIPCRKAVREEKSLQWELGLILANKDNLRVAEMERISYLYEALNKPEKAALFKRRAENLRKKLNRSKGEL